MRKSILLLWTVLLCAALSFTSCGVPTVDRNTTNPPSDSTETPVEPSVLWTDEDTAVPDLQGATAVHLNDRNTTVDGDGVSVKEAVVTVTAGGTYVFDGSLSDGQIRVDSADEQTVRLVLDGVSVHSNATAPLVIVRSEQTIVTLAKGSDNVLSDSAQAVFEDAENEEPSGTLFSKSDLTLGGDGSLTVNAAFRDGIVSRDGLKLAGGNVTVNAADDAVMGRDYVLIGGGTWSLTAQGDGIKSTNDGGEGVGFVQMENGTVNITCEKDGVQATSALTVSGGDLTVKAGGGYTNGAANTQFDFGWGQQSTDSQSVGKGLKAGTALTVHGGQLTVDSADDALHSNGTIVIDGGLITASSGDDGVHADTAVTLDGGTLTVANSYEALEAPAITINNGDISLTASDDGINASSGAEGSTGDPYGQNPFAADDSQLLINGGKLTVDASGDGLDSNGTARMCGGEVWVCGPSNGGNGTLDFGASFDIEGGVLVAVGSLGMAQSPTSNTQQSILWSGCSLQSGDTLAVTGEDGRVLASIVSARTAQWAYVTSPLLEEGKTVTVSDGSSEQTLTLTNGVNTIGSATGGFGGSGGMGGPGMGGPGMGGPPGGHGRPFPY